MEDREIRFRELIEKLSKVNRHTITRVNLSDRYLWGGRYSPEKNEGRARKVRDRMDPQV